MTNLLISPDTAALARWSDALPDTVPYTLIDDIETRAVAASDIAWLHLRGAAPEVRKHVAEATRKLSPARIVALSDCPSDEQALEAMDCGAAGYCHSHAHATLLKHVAAVVSNQGLWVTPNLLTRLIRAAVAPLQPVDGTANPALAALSAREREVAQAVSAGASNKEIARSMSITERTVKAHLSAIFLKLSVRDRLHLALLMRGRSH